MRPTAENADRVLRALRIFGAPLFDLSLEDLTKSDTVFQMGLPPARIDLLTGISGVQFEQAWAHRHLVDLGPQRVAVLSLEDFAINKAATGRPKDLHDLVWIKQQVSVKRKP